VEGLLLLVGLYVVITLIARAQKEQARRASGERQDAATEERGERLAEWRQRLAEQLEEQGGVLRPAAGEASAAEMAGRLMGITVRPGDLAEPSPRGRRLPFGAAPPPSPPEPPARAPVRPRPMPRVAAAAPAAAVPPPAEGESPAAQRLARLAGGGLRGAVVLSEILGTPRGAL
jgi:hypothetical protein